MAEPAPWEIKLKSFEKTTSFIDGLDDKEFGEYHEAIRQMTSPEEMVTFSPILNKNQALAALGARLGALRLPCPLSG